MKIGDMVRCTKDRFYSNKGEVGVVVNILNDGMVGVKWQRFRLCRHTCNGHCTDRFGYYMWPSEVRVIK